MQSVMGQALISATVICRCVNTAGRRQSRHVHVFDAANPAAITVPERICRCNSAAATDSWSILVGCIVFLVLLYNGSPYKMLTILVLP